MSPNVVWPIMRLSHLGISKALLTLETGKVPR
jgi:hypothetical protein